MWGGEADLACYGSYSQCMRGLRFAAACCKLSLTSWGTHNIIIVWYIVIQHTNMLCSILAVGPSPFAVSGELLLVGGALCRLFEDGVHGGSGAIASSMSVTVACCAGVGI